MHSLHCPTISNSILSRTHLPLSSYMQNMFKIDNELKNANTPRTIRFTEPLFEKLNSVAQQNGISFNLLVLQCCKYALDNMEKEQ